MYYQFKRVKLTSVKKAAVALTAAMMFAGATGITVSSAQQSGSGNGPTGPDATRINPGVILACSNIDYTNIAAKALGLTSPALRLALTSGKSLKDIAASKTVDLTTVQTALKTAYEADLAQAVTDGLLTQVQGDQLKTRLDAAPAASATAPAAAPTAAATQAAPNGTDNDRPGFGGPGNGPRGPQDGLDFLRIAETNQVHTFEVAAKAIGVSCPDLVKAVEGGQSLAQVATSKNVTAQTVIDALTAAEKTAVAQDVTEGLITQAQADRHTANIANRITQMVNNAGNGPREGRGPGPGGPGFGGQGPRDGNGPGNGPANGNGQPPAAATPAVGTSS